MKLRFKMAAGLTCAVVVGFVVAEVWSHDCSCDPGDPVADARTRGFLDQHRAQATIGDVVRIRDVRTDDNGNQYEVEYTWNGEDFDATASHYLPLVDNGGGASGDPGGSPSPGPGTGGGGGGYWDFSCYVGGVRVDCETGNPP